MTDVSSKAAYDGPGDSAEAPREARLSATDRLYAKYDNGTDRPAVHVWMPTSIPWGRLQVVAHGCGEPDTLPDAHRDQPIAFLTIAGIEIGGWLEDLELQVAAAQEALEGVRRYYDELREASDE